MLPIDAIDRNKVKEACLYCDGNCDICGDEKCITCRDEHRCEFMQMIDEIPTITQEPRRGKWIKDEAESAFNVVPIYYCSACKDWEAYGDTEKTNYCPYCGARMDADGERREETQE